MNFTDLPRLKLEKVALRKNKKGWQIQGRLLQLGDTTFRLPIELVLVTKKGREKHKVWLDSNATNFDLHTQNEPQKLIVDPDFEILKIQRMPPRIWWYWDVYPDLIVIYGSLAEAEVNKAAAERFADEVLELSHEIIRQDIDVNEEDLKTKCVFLFGRPGTNKITQRFKDIFPIKIHEDKFTWQGTTYDQPTQGVAQIVENPLDPKSVVVLYTALSSDAIQRFHGLYLYDTDASYVIFDRDKQLISGDWKEYDNDLVWNFE